MMRATGAATVVRPASAAGPGERRRIEPLKRRLLTLREGDSRGDSGVRSPRCYGCA